MTEEVKTDWLETVITTYKSGGSDVEVCKALNTTMYKFNALYNSDSKFAELVDFGRTLSHAWWMEQARFNLTSGKFNTSLWSFVMKNRFGWADKTESSMAINEGGSSLEEVKNKLEKELPKLLKKLRPDLKDSDLLKELTSVNG